MPLYYDSEAVAQDDIDVANQTWQRILSGDSDFIREIQSRGISIDGNSIFRKVFFQRFFDVHEYAAPLFSPAAVRSGQFLGSMLNI